MARPGSNGPTHPPFHLDIVSLGGNVFSGSAITLVAPAQGGEVAIYVNHAPLLTRLMPGELKLIRPNDDEEFIYVSGGMMEVQPTIVTILADMALRSDEIDEAAAMEAKKRAEEALQDAVLFTDRDHAYAELIKALAQLQTVQDARKKLRGRRGA